MPDESRLQVRINDAEHAWGDVGHKTGDQVLPVDIITEGGLEIGVYDYVSMALSAGDTTETYIFKTGGPSGTTVATVVIVYVSSDRDVLSSVTKT